jgi:uncharacterized membrane protein
MSLLLVTLFLRWLHIFGAIILAGGVIYSRCVLLPASQRTSGKPGEDWQADARRRWMRLVMLASGFLLLSGFVNFGLIVSRYDFPDAFPGNVYHAAFGIKFLLALGVFYLSGRLAGRSAAAERFRQRERMHLTINLVLVVLIVCIAGLMKMTERQQKATASTLAPPAAHASLEAGFGIS